jgi:hypothetical protein
VTWLFLRGVVVGLEVAVLHRAVVLSRAEGRVDVGSCACAGGGFPVAFGLVAGGFEFVVVQARAGAPVAGDGAAAGSGGSSALGAGALGGALVPPDVVQLGNGVAEGGADGRDVAADKLADGGFTDAERSVLLLT